MLPADTVRVRTPEHVVIDLEPAGLGARGVALILDYAVITSVTAVIQILIVIMLPRWGTIAFLLTANFIITWGYHVVFEVYRQGQTPGKRYCQLRVVDLRGLPVSPQQSFIRNVIRVADFMPFLYAAGMITAVIDSRGRRLGDLAAGTLVIIEREQAWRNVRIPGLPVHNTLRTPEIIRKTKNRLGKQDREFLISLCQRADRLDNETRYQLMEDAASHFRQRLGENPEHMTGESFIRSLTALVISQ